MALGLEGVWKGAEGFQDSSINKIQAVTLRVVVSGKGSSPGKYKLRHFYSELGVSHNGPIQP